MPDFPPFRGPRKRVFGPPGDPFLLHPAPGSPGAWTVPLLHGRWGGRHLRAVPARYPVQAPDARASPSPIPAAPDVRSSWGYPIRDHAVHAYGLSPGNFRRMNRGGYRPRRGRCPGVPPLRPPEAGRQGITPLHLVFRTSSAATRTARSPPQTQNKVR